MYSNCNIKTSFLEPQTRFNVQYNVTILCHFKRIGITNSTILLFLKSCAPGKPNTFFEKIFRLMYELRELLEI